MEEIKKLVGDLYDQLNRDYGVSSSLERSLNILDKIWRIACRPTLHVDYNKTAIEHSRRRYYFDCNWFHFGFHQGKEKQWRTYNRCSLKDFESDKPHRLITLRGIKGCPVNCPDYIEDRRE